MESTDQQLKDKAERQNSKIYHTFDSYFFLFFHIIFVPLRKSHQRHLFRRRNQLKAKVLTKERNLYEIFRATRQFLFYILSVLTRVRCELNLSVIVKQNKSEIQEKLTLGTMLNSIFFFTVILFSRRLAGQCFLKKHVHFRPSLPFIKPFFAGSAVYIVGGSQSEPFVHYLYRNLARGDEIISFKNHGRIFLSCKTRKYLRLRFFII